MTFEQEELFVREVWLKLYIETFKSGTSNPERWANIAVNDYFDSKKNGVFEIK